MVFTFSRPRALTIKGDQRFEKKICVPFVRSMTLSFNWNEQHYDNKRSYDACMRIFISFRNWIKTAKDKVQGDLIQ